MQIRVIFNLNRHYLKVINEHVPIHALVNSRALMLVCLTAYDIRLLIKLKIIQNISLPMPKSFLYISMMVD